MAKAEGRSLEFQGLEAVDRAVLETFPYEGPRQRVSYVTQEWSAVCPFSGLPDFGMLTVDYVPRAKCVELKSLKYYLLSYRNVGIYQEAVTGHLYHDLLKLLEPQELTVKLVYQTRGGIDTTTSVSSQDNA